MNRAQTYYELLGVSRDADAGQIRAAYLRLMKTYHPDVVGNRAGTGDFIRLINRVYAALSDPARRASYDAELRHQSLLPLVAPGSAPVARRRWSRELMAGVIVAGVLAAVILISPTGRESNADQALGQAFAWRAPALVKPVASRPVGLPQAQAIRNAARLGAMIAAAAGERQSRGCFAASQARNDLAAAELCVVFDDAFLYAHQGPQVSAPLSPYFYDVVVRMRHGSALAPLGPVDPWLDRLWSATFAALMADLRAPSAATVRVTDVASPQHSDHPAPQRDRISTGAPT